MRVLPLAISSLLLLGGTCPPSASPPDAPRIAPRMVRRTEGLAPVRMTPARIVGGFLYPVRGEAGTFEIDAPLVTPRQNRYYSMEIHYAVNGVATLNLQWRQEGGNPVAVQIGDNPCEDGWATRLRLTSLEMTGREVPVSYNEEVDAAIDAGRPVAWITCGENIDEIIAADTVFSNVAILLPASLIEPTGRGVLSARARFITGGPLSEATEITIRQSPATFAAAGDSVVWGQGNTPAAKAAQLFANLIPGSRLIMKAHSGALLKGGDSTTIRGVVDDADCGDAAVPGEILRNKPSVQCQLRDLAKQRCIATNDRVPRFFCDGDPVPQDVADRTLIDFDTGPRIDVAIVNGCINDVGPRRIFLSDFRELFGTNLNALAEETSSRCDLRNAISDFHEVFPNADLYLPTYHFVVSNLSDPSVTGCLAAPASFESLVLLALTTPARQDLHMRSVAFQSSSAAAYAQSAPALDGHGRFGRGRVFVADMRAIFNPATAQAAPATLLWNLNCTGGLFVPTDPVAGQRAIDCTAFFNPTGTNPNSAGEEACLRASAFHPNAAAQLAIATRMRGISDPRLRVIR